MRTGEPIKLHYKHSHRSDHIDSLGNSHSPELAINIIPTAPTLQKNNIEDNVNDPPPTYEEALHTNNVTKISLETLV